MINHQNNVGVLRLLFASLVIVGHAPEQIDGDRHRELLTMIFHTISLGQVSVAAFFLLSGYLITMSMDRSTSLKTYLERRALRIWPGYLVVCVLSTFVLAPIVGGQPLRQGLQAYLGMLFLFGPVNSPEQLAGLPYPVLNGSIWTIALEFFCYLIVAVLGVAGLLKRRRLMTAATLLILVVLILGTFDSFCLWVDSFGHRGVTLNLTGNPLKVVAVFVVGAVAYLHREELSHWVTGRKALICAVIAAASLFNIHTAETGLAVFGGIALFWISFKARFGPIQRINDRWDISYGTYLYGWPIAITILYFDRSIGPVELALVTLPLALLAGAASWFLVERWSKDLFKSRRHKLTVSPQAG